MLKDGWYVTGDIAIVDEDGFVRITDRLARFSKIGGEMVPHGRVEEALHIAAGIDVPTFVVTALADEKKGERSGGHPHDGSRAHRGPSWRRQSRPSGLPNLFLPRADAFVKVDALPLLGTGKLDLRRAKDIARDALGPKDERGAGA